jgi:hypothetical protein
MKNLALAIFGLTPLFAAVGALAQGIPPPEQTCENDAECPDGSSCLLPDCPVCDPDSPDCQPVDCGPGVCVANPPPEVECTLDSDCPEDQFCAIRDCAPPCDPDDPTCEPVDCTGGGVCIPRDPVEPPPSCTTDEECGDGNVCITQTAESCRSEGCVCADDGDGDPSNDPPCDCPPPSEPECTTETYSFCGPRWLDECAVDADCGAGFACLIHDACDCSTDPCDCPTEPGVAPPGACELVRVECTDESDCTDGFVCTEEAATEPCAVDETGANTCDAPAATRICAPPGYEQGVPVNTGEEPRSGEDGTADDDNDDDTDDDTDDEGADDVANPYLFACTQTSGVGLGPLVALGLFLLRRRRR